MYRAVTKCSDCGDVLWFDERDVAPQEVLCSCGATYLDEDGPHGQHTSPTTQDLEAIP